MNLIKSYFKQCVSVWTQASYMLQLKTCPCKFHPRHGECLTTFKREMILTSILFWPGFFDLCNISESFVFLAKCKGSHVITLFSLSMCEWRKIRYWLDLCGCQVLQVMSSISLQGVSTILRKIYQRRSHICEVLHQVGTFCSSGSIFMQIDEYHFHQKSSEATNQSVGCDIQTQVRNC